MAKLIEYVGAAVIASLPAIMAMSQYCNPLREPQLRPSTNPNEMVWSYPGEYQARNFKDVRPFGSLDEVVLRTQDGKVVTLSPNNKGFQEQERVYHNLFINHF